MKVLPVQNQTCHIFGTISFCYVQNKTKLDPCFEKGIFVSYDKPSSAYLIYFLETTAIRRVGCVKFMDSNDNSPQSKQDKNTELADYIPSHMMNN